MHKLTIEDDEGKTVVVPLIREEITVGRQEGNSIRLTERNISRRHARFFRQSGNLFVEDLGSYTGIKVSGQRISAPTMLKDGDLVVIGDYKLTVRTDKPVATKLYGGGSPFTTADGTKPLPTAPSAPPASLTGRPAPLVATAPLPIMNREGAASVAPVAPAAGPGGTAVLPSLATAATAEAPPPSPAVATGAAAPAPDASLDAAPTIPVRTLAEQGLAGDAPAPARLVVTATSLAGAEFALDRPSLVIGRTPENDIVLNHKSISRHHAKIIRDGDKYIVVDLESANGVRVNGAEFERVELQSGDTLELGHVRMKFTAGGEFVDLEVAGGGAGRKRMLLVGAIGSVVAAAVVLSLASGGSDSGPANQVVATAPATPPPAAPPPAAVAPTPPPPPPPPAAPAMPEAEVQKLVTEAEAAMGKRKWDEASAKLDKILAAVPTAANAVALKQVVEGERAAMEKFDKLEGAAKARNFEEVVQYLGEIPESSTYRARAVALRDSAAKRFVASRLTEVEGFVSRGECEEARHEAERILAVDPANERAKALPDRCDRVAAQKAQREADRAERAALAASAQPVPAATPREVPPPPARPAPTPRPPAAEPVARATTPPPAPRAAPPVSAAPRPTPVAAAPRAPEPRPAAARTAPPAAAAPPETGDPELLLKDAQDAWMKGQFVAAIDSARRALKVRPNLPRAYQIIAVCSCSLRDADGAAKAYDRLDERMKPLVKSACQKSGVSLN